MWRFHIKGVYLAEKRGKMTQQNRKFAPLGIQDFEEMRRDHYIYADKTGYGFGTWLMVLNTIT